MTNVPCGIDLGTTNSVVAFVNKEGRPEVISSSEGGRLIPSVFAVTEDGEILVGQLAVEQEPTNAGHTVRSIKRWMGENHVVSIGGRDFTPIEISAAILRKIKRDAETHLQSEVTQAVITVPAYFNNNQREATKKAGELAGLQVLRVINEPTAASLAYGIERKTNERILVYDLGGGTFDVTILQIYTDEEDGAQDFKVLSTDGDTRLGGDDIDFEIVKMIKVRIPQGVVLDIAAEKRIRTAAESAKKQLSAAKRARISIPYVAHWNGEPVNIDFTIERDDLEIAITPLLARTKNIVENAFALAKLGPRDIDEVVFVGGSTRVPAVYENVRKWLHREPNRSINPDEAVAIGAAIQAALLTNQGAHDIVLFDVTPLTLGIETVGGEMTRMVRRNERIPFSRNETFSTAEDNQDRVEIRVYQGERPMAKHNMLVGSFHLVGIKPAPKGVPQIEVTFSIDANGILAVKAVDQESGSEQEVVMTGGPTLTSEEVKKIVTEAEANRTADENEIQIKRTLERINTRIKQVDQFINNFDQVLGEEMVDHLRGLRESLVDALNQPERSDYVTEIDKDAKQTVEAASKRVQEYAERAIKAAGAIED